MRIPCFISEGEDKHAHLRSSQFCAQIICAKIIRTKFDHARNLIERFSSETKNYKTGTKRKGNSQQKKSRIINISPNHPYKNVWNVFTILLTLFLHMQLTSLFVITDMSLPHSPFLPGHSLSLTSY